MGNEYVARKKNEPMNHSKSYSPNKSYIEVPNPPIQSVRQFKTNDKSEYSDVIQLNVSGLNGYLYDKFNKVKEDAKKNSKENGTSTVLGELLLTEGMENFEITLGQVPTTPGVNPNQGNHIFNALGNSLWNFWDDLIKNVGDDKTVNASVRKVISELNNNNLYEICKKNDSLRNDDALLFKGTIASNNQITYALYSIKYFYDCTQLVTNAMIGIHPELMYAFNIDQAIDQPALDAQKNKTNTSKKFTTACDECKKNGAEMITLFTNSITGVANIIYKSVK